MKISIEYHLKGFDLMELTVKLNFWFDGIDDCSEEEILKYLKVMLEDGAESTCSEVDLLHVENESGTL